MVTRQPRIFDSSILAIMRNGATFFCLVLHDRHRRLCCPARRRRPTQQCSPATSLTALSQPKIVWELKILLLMVFLANGFPEIRLGCAPVSAIAPSSWPLSQTTPSDNTAYPHRRQSRRNFQPRRPQLQPRHALGLFHHRRSHMAHRPHHPDARRTGHHPPADLPPRIQFPHPLRTRQLNRPLWGCSPSQGGGQGEGQGR